MPLNRPLQPLDAKPSTVQFARSWAANACHEIDRGDLVDSVQLGVSELVTNALLHGEPPYGIRLRGTRLHPRVEVTDSSQDPPAIPAFTDPEDMFNTFGRGLSIVAACSTAWGAVIEDSGKFVWFEPSHDLLDDPSHGMITDLREHEEPVLREGTTVSFQNVPVEGVLSMRRRYFDLRRELRLLQLSHEGDYPVARELVALFGDYEDQLPPEVGRAARDAQSAQETHFDIVAVVRNEAGPLFKQMDKLFDLADEFCRSEQLLALARSDEEREFQHWFLGELVDQLAGKPPSPWRDSVSAQD